MNYRLLLPTSLSLLFSSCYSISVASQYLCLLNSGQKLHKVQKPSVAEQQLFTRVRTIKNFSEQQLGLRATQNYSNYVRLNRNYLTVVVSAAPQLAFNDYLWNYPFVGKLPYKGYFAISKAKKEAAKLQQKNYDVLIRAVDAFSTLGYLRDPLFSYMANYSEKRLAELIIHESFHATLFVRGDISLNESLANLVGKYGSQLYMQAQQPDNLTKPNTQLAKQADSKKFRHMILTLKEELNTIYSNANITKEQAINAKKETINNWQQQFNKENYSKIFWTERYQYMAKYPVNNAYLALFSLYEDPDNFLENIYQYFLQPQISQLTALKNFIAHSKKLGKQHGRHTRSALKNFQQELATQQNNSSK